MPARAVMPKRVVIRDPIHGYVELTTLEQRVVSHRISQRLRNVLQNGLAHLVYPEARTSRFSHSLGTMHLASIYFTSCLENSTAPFRTKLIRDMRRIIGHTLGRASALDLCKPLQDRALRCAQVAGAKLEDNLVLTTTEQAVRLAALFHDLGHLPYSHDFEESLQSYWLSVGANNPPGLRWLFEAKGGAPPQPHEEIGHKLAELLLKERFGEDPEEHARVAFELGLKILNAPEPALERPASVLEWLKSLTAGELDVDRADYLQRDARAFGFEFAGFDSHRLFENAVLVHTKERGYETAVRDKAVTALESFYLARARSHQHLVRHHKVAQAGAALAYCSAVALSATTGGKTLLADLAQLGTFNGSSQERSDLLNRFSTYDDGFWTACLRELEPKVNRNHHLLKACLAFVLRREEGLRSVWKRAGDFPKPGPRSFNERFGKLSDITRRSRARKLEDQEVLVRVHTFRPTGKQVVRVLVENNLRDLVDFPAMVAGLEEVFKEDVQVHAFVERGKKIEPASILDALLGSGSSRQRRGRAKDKRR